MNRATFFSSSTISSRIQEPFRFPAPVISKKTKRPFLRESSIIPGEAGGKLRPGPPGFPEVDASLAIKPDSLFLQKTPLPQSPIPSCPNADFALVIDDPLPGNPGSPRKGRHGVTDHPGRAAPDDLRDLAVGGNFARRDLSDRFIDLLVPGYVSPFHTTNLFKFTKKCNCF
jgi:hypothetical protein